MNSNETTIRVNDMTLAVKTWGDPGNPAIIALHGWQDNAGSFDNLAPLLPEFYWIVPDLPGHGLSEHRGASAEYTLWSYCLEVIALAQSFSLGSFILLGHSMGGGIASLLAGLYPKRISKLVLLDVIGVLTTEPSMALEQMLKGLGQRLDKPARKAGRYGSVEQAVAARAKKGITTEAANSLGERGIQKTDDYFYWNHDQRLSLRSLLSMSDEQMKFFLEAIVCEVLLVTSNEAVLREAAICERTSLVKNIQVENLTGGHHQHLDGDVGTIAALISSFLRAEKGSN